MGACPNCGSAGQANRDCATVSTDILWGGPGLCIGVSSGTLDDVIVALSNAVCGVVTGLPSLALNDTSITVTTGLGTCVLPATALLSSWIPAIETVLCALKTTVEALDYTEPLHYDGTANVIALNPAYVVSDTIAVAADTLNEAGEYLKLELFVSVPTYPTGVAAFSVAFLGATIPFIFTLTPPYYMNVRLEMNFVYSAAGVMQYDYTTHYQRFKNEVKASYSVGTTVSPVDWTISNNLVISAYNTIDTITVHKVRLTKYCKH